MTFQRNWIASDEESGPLQRQVEKRLIPTWLSWRCFWDIKEENQKLESKTADFQDVVRAHRIAG